MLSPLSPAKLRALRALHARRRGVRVNRPGLPAHQLSSLLADLLAAVREPVRGVCSRRVLAHECRVSDRTIRRWLDGTDLPPAPAVLTLRRWLRSL